MEVAWKVMLLAVGGACGVNARYWLDLTVARWLGVRVPWATFAVNNSGSFAIGLLAVFLAERWPNPSVRLFAITGFLGGYTTFSAYTLESLELWDRGDRNLATANLFGSLAAELIAVALGVALGCWIFEPTGLCSPEAQANHDPSPDSDSLDPETV